MNYFGSQCPTCFDTKGLCGDPDMKTKFFVLTLQEGFEDRTVLTILLQCLEDFVVKYAC